MEGKCYKNTISSTKEVWNWKNAHVSSTILLCGTSCIFLFCVSFFKKYNVDERKYHIQIHNSSNENVTGIVKKGV